MVIVASRIRKSAGEEAGDLRASERPDFCDRSVVKDLVAARERIRSTASLPRAMIRTRKCSI